MTWSPNSGTNEEDRKQVCHLKGRPPALPTRPTAREGQETQHRGTCCFPAALASSQPLPAVIQPLFAASWLHFSENAIPAIAATQTTPLHFLASPRSCGSMVVFSQNKSHLSTIPTKYDCNSEAFPWNGVNHGSRNSSQTSSPWHTLRNTSITIRLKNQLMEKPAEEEFGFRHTLLYLSQERPNHYLHLRNKRKNPFHFHTTLYCYSSPQSCHLPARHLQPPLSCLSPTESPAEHRLHQPVSSQGSHPLTASPLSHRRPTGSPSHAVFNAKSHCSPSGPFTPLHAPTLLLRPPLCSLPGNRGAFSCSAPQFWKSHPHDRHNTTSANVRKSKPHTQLFRLAHPS